MFQHLLVPTDGSEIAAKAVAGAVRFAATNGARITFFYAQPDFPMPIYGEGALIDPTTPEQFAESAAAEARKILDAALAQAHAAGVSASSETEVNDSPHAAIVAASQRQGCDLIFMASHGRSGLASLLLGSEAKKVLGNSTLPVLIYR